MFLPATPPLARPLPTPAIFAALAEERPQALLVVPMLAGTDAWPSEADYLQLMLPTWTPLANGYGRRTPPIYEALREAVAIYPRGSLAESLRFYGITHVAVLAAYAEDRGEAFNAAALANSQDFEPVVGPRRRCALPRARRTGRALTRVARPRAPHRVSRPGRAAPRS